MGCNRSGEPLTDLTLVASGDTAGWIVPCGCTSNQSGGMLRRGTFIQQLEADNQMLYVDVGGAAASDSEYDRLKFEAILHGEMKLGLVAHNLGASEIGFGLAYLRDVTARTGAPLVSCNTRGSKGELLAPPYVIAKKAGRRVGITGVVSAQFATDTVVVKPPLDALLATVETMAGKYDTLVVLAYLPEEELLELAGNLPEADLLVGGPTGQSMLPTRHGPTLVASATNKGKFVAQFTLPRGDSAPWSGTIVELDQTYDDHAEQIANLEAYYARLEKEDLAPNQTSFAKNVPSDPPAGFRVAGNATCEQCHASDCRLWNESKHAHAWASLTATGAHVDPYCQQCHTTGYGLPGGYVSRAATPAMVQVGCESCHGPSLGHAENPRVKTAYAMQAANGCTACHDRENSPSFEYDRYWQQVLHGTDPATSPLEQTE